MFQKNIIIIILISYRNQDDVKIYINVSTDLLYLDR